jgi:hypothetical protein
MLVAATWSRTYPNMGLLATGISCLAQVKVKGLSLVPLPPLRTSAFMSIPNLLHTVFIMTYYYHLNKFTLNPNRGLSFI